MRDDGGHCDTSTILPLTARYHVLALIPSFPTILQATEMIVPSHVSLRSTAKMAFPSALSLSRNSRMRWPRPSAGCGGSAQVPDAVAAT